MAASPRRGGSGEGDRGRVAGTGRHDDQCVASGHDAVDDALLERVEGFQTEALPQDVVKLVGYDCAILLSRAPVAGGY
ncbi:MAG: hypothetical protein ABIG44_17060 [Planctomycetota bacterium]